MLKSVEALRIDSENEEVEARSKSLSEKMEKTLIFFKKSSRVLSLFTQTYLLKSILSSFRDLLGR